MSVLINGAVPPIGCAWCYFNEDSKCALIAGCELDETNGTQRRKDCPLIELPDHGDLVDYRWLLSEYQNVCYGISCDECKLAAKDIRGGQLVITGCALEDFFAVAPVIIPAERSE